MRASLTEVHLESLRTAKYISSIYNGIVKEQKKHTLRNLLQLNTLQWKTSSANGKTSYSFKNIAKWI